MTEIDLNNKIWQNSEGGYRTLYDASIPLKELERSEDTLTRQRLWAELWNELHHQGDVGIASYLAVPQLVRIAKLKSIFCWDLLALCNIIEQQRLLQSNPPLPAEFEDYYKSGLRELKDLVLNNIALQMNHETYTAALATLASSAGHIKLARAITLLEDEQISDEFLEKF